MTFLPTIVIGIVLSMQCTLIASQPADIAGLRTVVDVQTNFISQTPETERIPELFVMARINYTFITPDGHVESFAYPKEVAKYGEGQIFDVSAELVYVTDPYDATDHKGCRDDIRDHFQQPLPTNRLWIALIQRGVCRFEEKVAHVYKHKAIGAIIYNHHDADNLDKMKIEDKTRKYTIENI